MKKIGILAMLPLLIGCSTSSVEQLTCCHIPDENDFFPWNICQYKVKKIKFDDNGDIQSFKFEKGIIAQTTILVRYMTVGDYEFYNNFDIYNLNYIVPYGIDKNNFFFTPLVPLGSINKEFFISELEVLPESSEAAFGVYDEKMLETFRNN